MIQSRVNNLNDRLSRGEIIEFAKPTIILASASPRRAKKLTEHGIEFIQIKSPVDDSEINEQFPHEGINKRQQLKYVKKMALAKLQPFIGKVKNGAVITCDTTALCDGRILEKPVTKEKCREQHEFISGKTAYTYNAMAVYWEPSGKTRCAVEIIKVKFKPLPAEVIEIICNEPETLDCAGYRRAGALGAYVVNNAPLSNGICMPLVLKMLKKLGFKK